MFGIGTFPRSLPARYHACHLCEFEDCLPILTNMSAVYFDADIANDMITISIYIIIEFPAFVLVLRCQAGSTLVASTPVTKKKRKSALSVENDYETKRHKTVEEGGATTRDHDEVLRRAVVAENAIRECEARIGVDLSERGGSETSRMMSSSRLWEGGKCGRSILHFILIVSPLNRVIHVHYC